MDSSFDELNLEVESTTKLVETQVNLDDTGMMTNENGRFEDNQKEPTKIMGNESRGTSGMGIFTGELWEPILDRLQNSVDILNVLRAFPELDFLFQSKKAYWLFDQVFPHLMTKHLTVKKIDGDDHNWTYSREMLQLRGVSKRWNKVIERSLQDHPDRNPPSLRPTSVNRNSVGLPGNHFNSQRMFRYNLGATFFQTCGQIDQFLEIMRHLTPNQNPFPGKSVVIKPDIQWYIKSFTLLQKSVELFEKFGKHVTTLEISFWDRMTSDSNLPLCKVVLDCLFHLPNLRSLTIKGELKRGEYATEANLIFGRPESQMFFPNLPFLKTFVCQVRYKGECSLWINRLFETYAKETGDLHKLGIQHDKYWTSSLPSNLTNLTELHLFVDYDCSPNLGKIEKVLWSLPNAGNLKKFGLSYFPLPAIGKEAVGITNLMTMFSGVDDFKVETLVLENLVLMEGEDEFKKSLTSVTSLCMQDDKKLSYDFLKMLPNLRWLTVYMQLEANEHCQDYEGNMERWEIEEEDGTEFAKSLRRYLLRAKYGILEERQDFEGIWRKLPPKLEMISASVEQTFDNVVDMQFVRECGNQGFLGWRLEEDEDGQGREREGCMVA